jgi:hypothetical protein
MAEHPAPAPIPRPSFIPASVDYDALPDDVRRALVNIVGPAYQDLVERALTARERSTAATLVFLLTMEVLDQFALARATDFSTLAGAEAAHQRDKLIESHLRLVSAKQMSARFMLRLTCSARPLTPERCADYPFDEAILENRNSVNQRRQAPWDSELNQLPNDRWAVALQGEQFHHDGHDVVSKKKDGAKTLDAIPSGVVSSCPSWLILFH